MPTIDINLHHLGLDEASTGSMASSGDSLSGILAKLNDTIEKLRQSVSKFEETRRKESGPAGASAAAKMSDFQQRFGGIMPLLGTSLGGAIGITAARMFHNEATAIMARATNRGNFIAAGVAGNANQQFGNYASQFVNIAAQRLMANNTALAEGIGGVAGGAIGSAAGFLGGPAVGSILAKGGFAAGATAGIGAGDYAAAKYYNQYIQQQALVKAALVQREANASVSEWRMGFARFGLGMTNTTLVPGSITGGASITAPLSAEFEKRYSGSQNYNSILNNIVPNLTSNPLSSKYGDLDKVAQRFLQAGYAVSDFGNLTKQSNQYMAVTGKTLQDFSKDASIAKARFGDLYTASTNQTAISLMATYGIGQFQAQSMAYQAQYNPGALSGLQTVGNSSYSDYYKRQAIAKMLGIGNIDKQLIAGHINDPEVRKELQTYFKGGQYGHRMLLYSLLGINPQQLAYETQQVVPGTNLSKSDQKKILDKIDNPSLAPGQNAAEQAAGGITSFLSQVDTVNMNATTVNLNVQSIDQPGIFSKVAKWAWHHASPGTAGYMAGMAPSPHAKGSSNPAKK